MMPQTQYITPKHYRHITTNITPHVHHTYDTLNTLQPKHNLQPLHSFTYAPMITHITP